jgi:UDP-N-acetylglucosamine--dolichyl-phosphate N-acetylglucosaminephosphotransferase
MSILAVLFSFAVTVLLTPIFIRFLRRASVIGTDIHKPGKPSLPASAGIPVALGIFFSLMFFVFIRTFLYENISEVVYVFAAVSTMLLITFIGFLDDLLHYRAKATNGDSRSGGLRRWQKPLLTLPAAIPMMVIAAGHTTMSFPLLGDINFGLLYPLLLIPIGVVGAANMVNLLGGLNGLEASLGAVYMFMLGLYAYFVANSAVAALIAFSTFGALLGVLRFNKYPAKLLPGDSIQYLLGASLVSIAVLGNMEKAALIISIPFFIELLLKLRGGIRMPNTTVGFLNKNGKVQSHYKKIYSLPHIWMRSGKYTERQVVWFMILLQLGVSSLIWLI